MPYPIYGMDFPIHLVNCILYSPFLTGFVCKLPLHQCNPHHFHHQSPINQFSRLHSRHENLFVPEILSTIEQTVGTHWTAFYGLCDLFSGFLTLIDFCLSYFINYFNPTLFLIVAKMSTPKRSAPYWSNLPFQFFEIRALWCSVLSARVPECQKIKVWVRPV